MKLRWLILILFAVSLNGISFTTAYAEQTQVNTFVPLLKKIQDDIVAGEDKHEEYTYYRDQYRIYETQYWYKIAGWMVEDSVERVYKTKKPVKKILDLGCGFGTLLTYASIIYGAEGICLDINNYLFPEFQSKYKLAYIKGDIEREPLPSSEKYNVIIMTEVLEHFNFEPIPSLRKIYNILAPGGSFFLSTPDSDAGWGRTYEYYRELSDIPPVDVKAKWIDAHIWQYNNSELQMVIKAAGFIVKRIDHTYVKTKDGELGHFNVWLTKK